MVRLNAYDKLSIKTMYLTKTPGEIADSFGVSTKYIRNLVSKAGLPPRTLSEGINLSIHRGRRKGSISKNTVLKPEVFDHWTPQSAWLLGLFLADGSITIENHHLFSLGLIDLETIEKVVSIIGYPLGSITHLKRSPAKDHYQIQSGNQALIDKLMALGVTPRKANNVKFPDHPTNMTRHILRGYIDGDGSFSNVLNVRFSLSTSSLTLITQATKILFDQAGVSSRKRIWSARNINTSTDAQLPIYESVCNGKPFYSIQTASKENLSALYRYLYEDTDWSICMHRKRAILEAHYGSTISN